MDSRGRTATVTYKRWKSPEWRGDSAFEHHSDEVQGADIEIHTATKGREGPASTFQCPETEETFTLNEALDALGFGKFQWKVSFLIGFSWVADAMEMMILSILGRQLHCEWRLPSYQVALITSVVFIGMGISSSLWGNMADKYGRKVMLIFCMCWTLHYSLLSAFAPSYSWILGLRGLVGFGIGGGPQSVTMYSEFLPSKSRGSCVILIASFWAIGAVSEVLLALLVMPTLGWRWLLVLSALPMAIFVCFCFWLPESPRFDMLTGKREKVMATLSFIAKENGKAIPRGRMINYKRNDAGRIKDLFSPQYIKSTLLLWFIWFSNAFSYFGMILLTAELFQNENSNGATQVTKLEPSCSLECKYLTSADYKDLLWTTLAEFPGLLVIIVLVDRIGRKKSMALCFFLFSLFILPIYASIERLALTIIIFIARAFISGGYQAAFVYTPEVFPTETRALAIGTCSAMSRLGALLTPFVAQVMLRMSMGLTLSIYCGFSLLGGIASLILPIETLGRGLQESSIHQ